MHLSEIQIALKRFYSKFSFFRLFVNCSFFPKCFGFSNSRRYSQYGKFPLIFVVTDTKSKTNNIGYSVFTDEFRERFKITTIAFNAVADTLLKNGLKRIQGIMSQTGFQKYYTEPNKEIIDSIVLTSQGDIRSAVINLHFASQKSKSQ